jgi:hypothetical protein
MLCQDAMRWSAFRLIMLSARIALCCSGINSTNDLMRFSFHTDTTVNGAIYSTETRNTLITGVSQLKSYFNHVFIY